MREKRKSDKLFFPTFKNILTLDKIHTFCYSRNMLHTSDTATITDKGYILLPYRIRKTLNLKPRQAVQIRVTKEKKIELEPMMTLDEVFRFFKPQKKRITQKFLKQEEKTGHEFMIKDELSK